MFVQATRAISAVLLSNRSQARVIARRRSTAKVQLLDAVNVSGRESLQPHLHHRGGVANTLLPRARFTRRPVSALLSAGRVRETLCDIESVVIFHHHQTQEECRIAIGDKVAAKLLHAAPARSLGNVIYRLCSRTGRCPGLERATPDPESRQENGWKRRVDECDGRERARGIQFGFGARGSE